MWLIEASGVCKVLLETSAINWRSSSIKLLEFIKISWRIGVSIWEATGRNILASCGQEVHISTLRSFEAVENLECFRIAKFLQKMKSTAICNSLSYSSLGMVTFPPERSTCSMTTFSGDNWEFHSFIQGINCRDHRDKCENQTHVVGSHITFLWSYLSATNREDKNARYDKQGEWWIIGDCYQVTIPLLNIYDHKTYLRIFYRGYISLTPQSNLHVDPVKILFIPCVRLFQVLWDHTTLQVHRTWNFGVRCTLLL